MPWKAPSDRQSQTKAATNRPGDPFYSSARWRKFRKWFLAQHPLCADIFGFHLEASATVAAAEVDHILDRKANPYLAFDEDNCRALCKKCHSRRTMLDG